MSGFNDPDNRMSAAGPPPGRSNVGTPRGRLFNEPDAPCSACGRGFHTKLSLVIHSFSHANGRDEDDAFEAALEQVPDLTDDEFDLIWGRIACEEDDEEERRRAERAAGWDPSP